MFARTTVNLELFKNCIASWVLVTFCCGVHISPFWLASFNREKSATSEAFCNLLKLEGDEKKSHRRYYFTSLLFYKCWLLMRAIVKNYFTEVILRLSISRDQKLIVSRSLRGNSCYYCPNKIAVNILFYINYRFCFERGGKTNDRKQSTKNVKNVRRKTQGSMMLVLCVCTAQ